MTITNMTPEELLAENQYAEVQEWLSETGKITDSMFAEHRGSIALVAGAMRYVSTYAGTSTFVFNLRNHLARKGELTDRQLRAALNVMVQELESGKLEFSSKKDRQAAVPLVKNAAPIEPEFVPEGGVVPVLEDTSESHFDISSLPDGYYAIPRDEGTGPNQFIFIWVKTLKKTVYRDRRYRFGKIKAGREYFPAGTIEVREWSQDAKRLAGIQRPGEGYSGEYMEKLVLLMAAPAIFAKLFSLHIGRCGVCGKTLTDDVSREQTIGPDCEKKWGSLNGWAERWTRWVPPVAS